VEDRRDDYDYTLKKSEEKEDKSLCLSSFFIRPAWARFFYILVVQRGIVFVMKMELSKIYPKLCIRNAAREL